MIKEFIEMKDEVALVARPRCFGKSLNMTMLREFFDITKDSRKHTRLGKIPNLHSLVPYSWQQENLSLHVEHQMVYGANIFQKQKSKR